MKNNGDVFIPLLFMFLLFSSCTYGFDYRTNEIFQFAGELCPRYRGDICIQEQPFHLLKKTKRYIVFVPGNHCFGSFEIYQDQFGKLQPSFSTECKWCSCSDPNPNCQDNDSYSIHLFNNMMAREATTIDGTNFIFYVKDIAYVFSGLPIYEKPDGENTLWARYPAIFNQKKKPIDLQPNKDGYILTFLTVFRKELIVYINKIHIKPNGEINRTESKQINGVRMF